MPDAPVPASIPGLFFGSLTVGMCGAALLARTTSAAWDTAMLTAAAPSLFLFTHLQCSPWARRLCWEFSQQYS
jgi:hypothetical protein